MTMACLSRRGHGESDILIDVTEGAVLALDGSVTIGDSLSSSSQVN